MSPKTLAILALVVAGTAALVGCGPTVTCGSGTTNVNGVCVPASADGGSSAPSVTCGAGTVEVNHVCVLASAPDGGTPTPDAATPDAGSGLSCGAGTHLEGTQCLPGAPIDTITVSPATISIPTGGRTKLTAAATYQGTPVNGVTFTWKAAPESVATIASDGTATAVATGDAQVTASAQGVTSAPATLTVTAVTIEATSIDPNSGPVGATVTITGSAFGQSAGTVAFGQAAATVLDWSDTRIDATVPTVDAGTVQVVVTTADGTAAAPLSFTVTATPIILAVTPDMLPPGTEGTIALSGNNLDGTTGVSFGDAGLKVVVKSATATSVVLDVTAQGNAKNGPHTAVAHTGSHGDSTTDATATNQLYVMPRTGAIWTIVGDGHAGNSASGTPGTSAELSAPRALAVADGVLFIADAGNHCVRAFGLQQHVFASGLVVNAGVVVNAVGTCGTPGSTGDGGDPAAAELKTPSALAYDVARDLLYIADKDDDRVRVVDFGSADAAIGSLTVPAGKIETLVGNGAPGSSGDGGDATAAELASPQGLYFYPRQNVLFIADTDNSRVRAVATVDDQTIAGVSIAAGQIATIAGGASGMPVDGPALQSPLGQPEGLAGNGIHQLFIADRAAKEVLAVNLDSVDHTLMDGLLDTPPGTLEILAGGDGSMLSQSPRYASTTFKSPAALVRDLAGGLHVVDAGNSTVNLLSTGALILYRVDAAVFPGDVRPEVDTATTPQAGYTGDWGDAAQAELSGPLGAAMSDDGTKIFVADTQNNVIREVSVAFGGDFFDGWLGDLTLQGGKKYLWMISSSGTTLIDATNPSDETTVATLPVTDGIYDFGNFTVQSGATVSIVENGPTERVFIAASGSIDVSGTILLRGGALTDLDTTCRGTYGAGFATAGEASGESNLCHQPDYSCPPTPPYGMSEMPYLQGGVGIGGGWEPPGGLMLIAQQDVSVDGTIDASGQGPNPQYGPPWPCGSSTGGGVKIVSTGGSVTVSGTINAKGYDGGSRDPSMQCDGYYMDYEVQCGGGGDGYIRLEAKGSVITSGATITPDPSQAGDITPAVNAL